MIVTIDEESTKLSMLDDRGSHAITGDPKVVLELAGEISAIGGRDDVDRTRAPRMHWLQFTREIAPTGDQATKRARI